MILAKLQQIRPYGMGLGIASGGMLAAMIGLGGVPGWDGHVYGKVIHWPPVDHSLRRLMFFCPSSQNRQRRIVIFLVQHSRS